MASVCPGRCGPRAATRAGRARFQPASFTHTPEWRPMCRPLRRLDPLTKIECSMPIAEIFRQHAQTLGDAPMPKLPVFATVARTYRAVFGQLGSIYRACWPWVLGLTPVAGYLAFFEARQAASEVAQVKVIWSLLSNVATISLAVAWQRLEPGWRRVENRAAHDLSSRTGYNSCWPDTLPGA